MVKSGKGRDENLKSIYDYFQKISAKIFFICMIYPFTERKNLIDFPYLDQGFI
jgi:hypothetical protein